MSRSHESLVESLVRLSRNLSLSPSASPREYLQGKASSSSSALSNCSNCMRPGSDLLPALLL